MSNETKEHFIFYIQHAESLPQNYFILSKVLKQFSLTLVPIKPEELANLAQAKKQFIISATVDLTSLKSLSVIRKSFLDFALVNQKYCLFDLSSFEKISISYKLEKNEIYFHYPLPMKLNKIGANIASHYFSEIGQVKRWPGGVRAKLPASI